MRLRLMTNSGCRMCSLISTSRSVPPARRLALPGTLASKAAASGSVRGSKYSKWCMAGSRSVSHLRRDQGADPVEHGFRDRQALFRRAYRPRGVEAHLGRQAVVGGWVQQVAGHVGHDERVVVGLEARGQRPQDGLLIEHVDIFVHDDDQLEEHL